MTDIHAAVPWPELYQNGELIIIILIPSWSTTIFKKQAQEIYPACTELTQVLCAFFNSQNLN